MCRARRLSSLDGNGESKKAPNAACQDESCFVYYQAVDDTVMCAACVDLAADECGEATSTGVIGVNPYVRALARDMWVAKYDADEGENIFVADLARPCEAAAPVDVGMPVNTPNSEVYPAISPDAKLLYFTRCTAGACRLWAAYRDDAGAPFQAAKLVAGIRAEVKPSADDIRAIPQWVGLEHDLDSIWFSSQRLFPGANPTADDHDVFVAHRAAGEAWDAPFEEPQLVLELSGPVFDAAPLPVSEQLWLGSWITVPNGPTSLYLLEMGCGRRFGHGAEAPYVKLSLGGSDETSPMHTEDGRIFFARQPVAKPGPARIVSAEMMGEAFADAKELTEPDPDPSADASDVDPFLLPDGRLLFASDRDGAFRLWITGDAAPERVFGGSGWERHPFVDDEGDLWLTWGADALDVGTIAFAKRSADGWSAPQPIDIGHVAGRPDSAPRLSGDRRRLLFTSSRDGGFFPDEATPWLAIRADPAGAWQAPYALTELSSVAGTVDAAWLAPDGCAITAAALRHHPTAPGWTRDLLFFPF